ncbi:hypothetical protein OQI89_12240 [Lentilactobacillus diolivorans]|mgnify:FL=1|uniref:hypothetical protein n=1 Tax=Lentilactobacillus diolivorans TaxID=179838 RepID=UPI0024686232|nr:hypothetical protein [Lentilactobacillus diolivorans]MDH5106622.1 hypothetical protein [Lentilactobacillus diolivorans]
MELSKIGIVLLSGLVLGGLVTLDNPVVYAKQETGYGVQAGNINRARGSQLVKEGYVFRLDGDKHNSGLWSQPTGNNRSRLTGHKELRRIIKDRINFKIYRVWQYKNGLQYKIVSQSGKYQGWIDNAGIYNKYSLDKQLQPIISQEQKVVNSINAKYVGAAHQHYEKKDLLAYQDELTKTSEYAGRLSGDKRLVALKSIGQVRNYIKNRNSNSIPTLLWPV